MNKSNHICIPHYKNKFLYNNNYYIYGYIISELKDIKCEYYNFQSGKNMMFITKSFINKTLFQDGGGGSTGAFVLLPSLTFRMSSGLKATGCCLGTDCLGTVEVVVFLTVE